MVAAYGGSNSTKIDNCSGHPSSTMAASSSMHGSQLPHSINGPGGIQVSLNVGLRTLPVPPSKQWQMPWQTSTSRWQAAEPPGWPLTWCKPMAHAKQHQQQPTSNQVQPPSLPLLTNTLYPHQRSASQEGCWGQHQLQPLPATASQGVMGQGGSSKAATMPAATPPLSCQLMTQACRPTNQGGRPITAGNLNVCKQGAHLEERTGVCSIEAAQRQDPHLAPLYTLRICSLTSEKPPLHPADATSLEGAPSVHGHLHSTLDS
jgi:hypothetical protein